jgi:hypothetical protein
MTLLLPSSRALHLADAALTAWVIAWIGLGVAIGVNVRHLTALSETLTRDGRAVEAIAGSLHSLRSVPLIGGEMRRVSPAPWTDVEAGRPAALAAAELRRLGLDPRLLAPSRHGHR